MLPHASLGRLSAAAVLLTLSLPAAGQCLSDRLWSSDAFTGDDFGRSLSTYGADLVVGAPGDDDSGTSSGAVYHLARGADGTYQQVQKLTAFDGGVTDEFGAAVSVDGDWLVVGARNDDDLGANAGAAYVFQRVNGAWAAGPKLTGSLSNDGDLFGASVAVVDGPTPRIAIGAYWHGSGPTSTGGAVYVFEYDGNAWNEAQFVRPVDVIAGDFFGVELDMVGDRLVVAATGNDAQFSSAGAIYVFDHDGNSFVQSAFLQPSDAATFINFGRSLDLGSDQLAACGLHAYVFEFDGNQWNEEAILVGSDNPTTFNDSIAISGDHLAVGDYGHNSVNQGAAWFFERQGGLWNETGMIDGFGAGDFFGRRVAFSGDCALVSGNSSNNPENGMPAGEVYVFPQGLVDCNSNGSPDGCDLYDGTSSDANADGVPDECGSNVFNYCSSTPNSTGQAAVMSMEGSVELSLEDFTLKAGPVPDDYGLFFYGPTMHDQPLGNGRLCITGSLIRFPATFAAGGEFSLAVDVTDPAPGGSAFLPGETWLFQCWFRDPGTGTGSDLSDGLSVTFLP